MKLLTITVPCYNAQNDMEKCIESLLLGGSDVEILIVNDGSTDNTGHIADEYAACFPSVVKAIHQENRGHGGAVNTGIEHASGRFFKVVDSDDWLDAGAYQQMLATLRSFEPADAPDMVLANYVYEKSGKKRKKVMRYTKELPVGRVFGWDDIGRFRKGHYILMHSIIYKTELLRQCNLQLPRHTFYVDNLYAFLPLPYVNTMYYLDVNLYRYYIGREGQSVQEATMIRRIDQQLSVNRLMVNAFTPDAIAPARKREYMFNYLEIVTMVSTALLIRSGTAENLQKRAELYRYVSMCNRQLYRKLRYGMLGTILNLPGRPGRQISVSVYRVAQRVVGFN